MSPAAAQSEIESFVRDWLGAMADKDAERSARLRADDYRLSLASGEEIDRAQELALLSAPDYRFQSVTLEALTARGSDGEAEAVAEVRLRGQFNRSPVDRLYRYTLLCRKDGAGWIAHHAKIEDLADYRPNGEPAAPRRVSRLRALLRPLARRLRRGRAHALRGGSFQELAYIPYRPGGDYILPPPEPAAAPGEELPVPPRELWLGYDYQAHGGTHVRTMLDLAGQSGLTLEQGDRILDLGCGAGRMIRHLRHLADRCEIWGADISAPHILWCRDHLSPPFHFATTTKVPHLPFEDRSFTLIYCGSLFTHIDDLADAWLLELNRLLVPGRGRLYVTIHDEHTIKLFDQPRYSHARIVQEIKAEPTFREAKEGFGTFAIGRDNESQIFYRRDYFAKMVSAAFDILSVTDEAYHYQTAFLLARKA